MLARPEPVRSAAAEVLANIRAERIGAHTVADLNAPDTFLRRVADRIIRESFEGRFRVVVANEPQGQSPSTPPTRRAEPPPSVRVVDRDLPPDVHAYRATLAQARPENRGFQSPVGGVRSPSVSMGLGAKELSPGTLAAAAAISQRLAPDGLLVTVARAIETLGLPRLENPGQREIEMLAGIGVPTDLLAGFAMTEGPGRPSETLAAIAATLRRAGGIDRCKRELARVPFAMPRTCDGFRACADSGQEPIRAVRVQVTSDSYWSGAGDGGCLDLIRQLAGLIPDATIVASVERKHADGFLAKASGWRADWGRRLVVVPEDLAVSQWSQDNGKSGRNAKGEPVLLLPRYASRGEVGATLVPGETFLAEGLVASGMAVARSPLHFQGGNLLVVQDGESGGRTLLLGEAEVWRNTALGLSAAQVEQSFKSEFGVDRIAVLPAASFHVDFEVTARTSPAGIVAFVCDAPAAASLILGCGIAPLTAAGVLGESSAQRAREQLSAGRAREALAIVGPAISSAAIGLGRFSEAFTAHFSTGPADHGPSNLYRVLLAMDLLAAHTATPAELPQDPATRAYLESFRHQEADRRLIRRQLQDLGFRTVAIPSLSEHSRGITAVNGLHEPGRYLMPSYGGLFAAVDEAAAAAIGRELGSHIKIVPIACAETQRRSGAVRCAVAVLAGPWPFGSR